MKRSMLNKDLQKTIEFMVEYPKSPMEPRMIEDKSVNFTITPDSLQNVKDVRFCNSVNFFDSLFLILEIKNSKF